jgi:YHS domain-containing protein
MSDFHSLPTQKQVKDPVCGKILPAEEAPAKIEHGSHTHYFCSEECKREFEKDPKKYH